MEIQKKFQYNYTSESCIFISNRVYVLLTKQTLSTYEFAPTNWRLVEIFVFFFLYTMFPRHKKKEKKTYSFTGTGNRHINADNFNCVIFLLKMYIFQHRL